MAEDDQVRFTLTHMLESLCPQELSSASLESFLHMCAHTNFLKYLSGVDGVLGTGDVEAAPAPVLTAFVLSKHVNQPVLLFLKCSDNG